VRIDWFTFFAQILNFVILVFLLKRFLYRPVMDAIARREAEIRGRLEEAHGREEAAEAESERLREAREEMDSRRSELLREAEQEAEERRHELAGEIRRHAAKVREDWHASLQRQRDTFLEELRRRIARETYALTARVLRDLADAELEDRAMGVFLQRVRALDGAERDEFLAALERSGGRIDVSSAFPMTSERRAGIERVILDWAGSSGAQLHFEEDPELALGIEMRAGDRKVGWSVGSYLEELEAEAARQLATENP
jgi:F-type H+-transporting ATPase subunit b